MKFELKEVFVIEVEYIQKRSTVKVPAPFSPSSSTKLQYLSGGVQDVSASDRALLHFVVNHLELRKSDDLEGCLDQTATVELDRLAAVLAVAYIRPLDCDHLDNRLKDWCLEVRACWETDTDDGTAGTDVLGGLLEWLLVDRDEDDGMRTKTIWSSLLHIGNDVLRLGKVDKDLCAKLLRAHLLLLGTGIDGDSSQTHGLSILASKRSKTTSSTDNGDPLAGLST
jgi:hypothetical protein